MYQQGCEAGELADRVNDARVHRFPTERAMLLAWRAWVQARDPDAFVLFEVGARPAGCSCAPLACWQWGGGCWAPAVAGSDLACAAAHSLRVHAGMASTWTPNAADACRWSAAWTC